MARRGWIHFRSDEDLDNRLDDLSERHGVSRSVAARMVLRQALGSGETNAVLDESFKQLSRVTQTALAALLKDFQSELPRHLQDALDGE